MPGKVNPSVPEMVNQVCFQVIGCDADRRGGLRGRAARAERDDAGHRLERAARVTDSPRGDDGARARGASTASPPTPRGAASCSTAARRSPPRSARTSATPPRPRSPRSRSGRGRSIREIVLERGVLEPTASSTPSRRPTRMTAPGRGGETLRVSGSSAARIGRRWPVASWQLLVPGRWPAPAAAQAAAHGAAVPAAGSRPARERPIATPGRSPTRSWTRCGIADGAVVADLGAGGGWFTVRLARRVGPNGRVYAEDIQRADDRGDQPPRAARGPARTSRPVLGTPTIRACRAGTLDAVLIVDTFHEMRGRRVALLQQRGARR